MTQFNTLFFDGSHDEGCEREHERYSPCGVILMKPTELPGEERRPVLAPREQGHCYDAEKCNADTFCDCPCARCIRVKRGECSTR